MASYTAEFVSRFRPKMELLIKIGMFSITILTKYAVIRVQKLERRVFIFAAVSFGRIYSQSQMFGL